MTRGLFLASAALVLAAGTVGVASAATDATAPASQKGKNSAAVAGAPATATTGVSQFNAAMEMAELARQKKDPVMMLGAARAVLAIGGTPGEDASKGGVADKAKPAAASATTTKADVAASPLSDRLLAEATTFARGNEVALGLIRETQADAGRGTPVGPHRHDTRLGGYKYTDYTERFVRGQLAEAAVTGDGDTDVDMVVYDANGNRVCTSARRGDREYCSWTPAWTGNFTVRVTNYGAVYNDVAMLVN